MAGIQPKKSIRKSWLRSIPACVFIATGAVGVLIAILQAFEIWTPFGVTERFQEVLLGLVSSLMLFAGLERPLTLIPIEKSVSLAPETKLASKLDCIEATASQANRLRSIGVHAFYPNRKALPPFPSFIESAKSDLLICALSADAVIQNYDESLKRLLENGCRIRFLLPDKGLMKDEKAIAHLAPQLHASRTPHHLTDALKYLSLLGSMAEKEGYDGKLEVRLLNFIPPMGFIMLDGHESRARIRIEQYVYKCDVSNRPSYEVAPTADDKDMFSMLRTQIELCWNEATEWQATL